MRSMALRPRYAEGAATPGGLLDLGMAMITKPFAVETLAARIRTVIAGTSA